MTIKLSKFWHLQSMISVLLPIVSTWGTYEFLLFVLGNRFLFLELASASIPISIAITCLIGLWINPIFSCSSLHLVILIGAWVVTGLIFHVSNHLIHRHYRIKLPDKISSFIILMFFVFLTSLSYLAICSADGKIIKTGENDMLLEMAYIASFANGANKYSGFITGFYNPLVSENPGKTEYLTSFYTALLTTTGMTPQQAIFILTVLLFISISMLIFCLTFRRTKVVLVALLAIPTVFLIGGFGFTHFTTNRDRRDPNVDYIFHLGSSKFNMWGHPLLHCFLTSRVVLLTMALSIAGFIFLENDYDFVAAVIGFLGIIVRPQTMCAYFMCFFVYKKKNFINRFLVVSLPVYFALKYIGMDWKKETPLWGYHTYSNSLIPILSYFIGISGLLIPSLIFSLWPPNFFKVFGPITVFIILSNYKMQEDLRFNFFALLSTVIPLIVVTSLTGLSNLLFIRENKELTGVISLLIILFASSLWISSTLGLWNRATQTYSIWDENDKSISQWIINNTSPVDVFASPVPGQWNPAIVLAGRIGYIGFPPAMQSVIFDNFRHEHIMKNFLSGGEEKPEIDFILCPKDSEWKVPVLSKVESEILQIVYENEKHLLLVFK